MTTASVRRPFPKVRSLFVQHSSFIASAKTKLPRLAVPLKSEIDFIVDNRSFVMSFVETRWLIRCSVVLVVVMASLTFSVNAQESQLGKVEFQTSGSEKAQAHFLRGLAALHSFWYEEALDAFRE